MRDRRLLVLAWMMPPLIFPRSLQISRTLRAMAAKGWSVEVIAVPPDVEPLAARDAQLAQFYTGSYTLNYVEPREEVAPSQLWLRAIRALLRTKNLTNRNWVSRASREMIRRIQTERPDAMVSFAQPWINHVAALRVKAKFPNLPWVAHFSDPWVDSPYFKPSTEKDRASAVQQERAIMASAEALVFTTQETAELVMAKYPSAWKNRVHIVPHGYEADLLGLVKESPTSPKFTITHTGNLYDKREPVALLHALAQLKKEVADEPDFQVNFVGHATQTMHDMVERLDIHGVVSLVPNTPFLESLAIAQAADLLLVIDAPAEHSVFLPSKVVEYLVLRRPILALTPKAGASARVLGTLGFPTVEPTDEKGILDSLRTAYTYWQQGQDATPIPPLEALGSYDIQQLVGCFETAIEHAIKTTEAHV
ncbi:MAG TPA: glycosyltransferase [Methylophilaceae bacterium]|nr:glycosyltransferase [Methylophilaceae bacterium]